MKIEKISDTQIKVFLNQSDLKERNIKLNELAHGSEKTQALFRELMEKAIAACGFEIENTPFMIEAIPVSSDSIMIIVSKITEDTDIENRFNLVPPSKDLQKFKSNSISAGHVQSQPEVQEEILIYAFKTLNDVTNVCLKINNNFDTLKLSSLYKNDGKYFLVLETIDNTQPLDTEKLSMILSEFGVKYISNSISKQYLIEHGERIIKQEAIKILSSY